MKKLQFFYILPLLCLGLLTTSCNDDDEGEDQGNTITITIDEPIDGETVMDCSDVHIHIDVVASDENHNVEVVLHPEGDVSDRILDIDEHDHDKEITIEQEVDLCSYPSGTCFHLEVEACIDHDCEEKQFAEAEFCIQ